ncbi:MAG: hypothetical protein ACRCYV_05025 [Aeromonas sp.]
MSKYQKDIVDALTKILGSRAFFYEKAQNNHLKVMIEGLAKPLFTSATPSDRRSKDNFLSKVRGQLRDAEQVSEVPTMAPPPAKAGPCPQQRNKLIAHIIRNFRSQLSALKDKERAMVLTLGSVFEIMPFRRALISAALDEGLRGPCRLGQLTRAERRAVSEEISRHVNFMLPDLGFYAQLLKRSSQQCAQRVKSQHSVEESLTPQQRGISSLQQASVAQKLGAKDGHKTHMLRSIDPSVAERLTSALADTEAATAQTTDNTAPVTEHHRTPPAPVSAAAPKSADLPAGAPPPPRSEEHASQQIAANVPVKPVLDSAPRLLPVQELLKLSKRARLQQFKTLHTSQAQQLLAELSQAMQEKHEEDLDEVLALIAAKGLSLDEVRARLAANAA